MWDTTALYLLQTPARRTSANGGSAWPTPQAFDATDINRSPEALARAKEQDGCANLREVVKNWATPTVDDANHVTRASGQYRSQTRDAQMWTTPSSYDPLLERRAKYGSHITTKNGTIRRINEDGTQSNLGLPAQVAGALNPDWEELLQGFPIGWTSLDGLPDPASANSRMSRRASRPAARPTGRRGLRRLAMPSSRRLSTRYSWR